jgi:hypothetical protein
MVRTRWLRRRSGVCVPFSLGESFYWGWIRPRPPTAPRGVFLLGLDPAPATYGASGSPSIGVGSGPGHLRRLEESFFAGRPT